MEIQGRPVAAKGDGDRFTGEVWVETLVRAELPSRLRVNAVHFAPGARTAWHAHAVGQTLIVTEGVGRVQSRGGEVHDVRPGDTIATPPGEWHWHGAAPDHVMTHLAVWEAPTGSGPESEWGAAVTEDEYLGARSPAQPPEAEPEVRARSSSGPWASGPASSGAASSGAASSGAASSRPESSGPGSSRS
jgi:quercetin dioxygenase-like cupin family protein